MTQISFNTVITTVMFFVLSCSIMPSLNNDNKTAASTKPVKPEPARDLGSLWSERSRWNEFFVSSPLRATGDIIVVELSDGFKAKFKDLAFKMDGKKDSGSSGGGNNDTRSIETSINEILPRGAFAISATRTVHVGNRQGTIELTGNIRESDISASDSTSADSIFNMKLEVKSTNLIEDTVKKQEKEEVVDQKTTEPAKPAAS